MEVLCLSLFCYAVFVSILMYFPLFVGVLCLSLFCYALLCVHSTVLCYYLEEEEKAGCFAIIVLQMYFIINIMWFFLMVRWVGLQCVIVVFPDYTHLLLNLICQLTPYVCLYV